MTGGEKTGQAPTRERSEWSGLGLEAAFSLMSPPASICKTPRSRRHLAQDETPHLAKSSDLSPWHRRLSSDVPNASRLSSQKLRKTTPPEVMQSLSWGRPFHLIPIYGTTVGESDALPLNDETPRIGGLGVGIKHRGNMGRNGPFVTVLATGIGRTGYRA